MVTRWMPVLLLRWKGTIFVTFALVLAAGTGIALSAPRVLESRSTILIDRATASVPTRNDSTRRRKTLETLATERRVILSRATAEAVVVELGLEFRASTSTGGPIGEALGAVDRFLAGSHTLSERERWIRRITGGLRVSTDLDSSMLTIRYADQDPDLAKSVVDAAVQEYMNRRLGADAGPDLRGYYTQKLLDLRQRHARLNALQEQNAVTAIGANRSRLVLDSKALQARISELKSDLNALQEQNSVTTIGTNRSQPVLDSQDLQGRISELKSDLQARRERPPQADTSSITRLRDEVRVVGSGLERLGSQIERLGSEIALTQNLGFMIDAAEQQLIDYQAKFAAAPIRQDAIELINVEIVERATNPVPSALPNLLHLLAAAVAALAAGLLAALLRQFLGGQIRSAAQVEEILALPVYGSLGKYHPT
ncbi:MAG: hypothetical protein IH905_08120 [Proteobacteria bacterium]|nr:hypothetical protein [Pseudomonadota bacterium]